MASDRDERLRLPARRVAEPRGLPAREKDRLHLAGDSLARFGHFGKRLERGALPTDPFICEACAPCLGGIEQVASVDDQRTRHRLAYLRRREAAELVPLR